VRYLLDTHIILWWLYDDPQLPRRHRQIVSEPDNHIIVSVASLWEIEIKMAVGKLVVDPGYIDAVKSDGFELLSIHPSHVVKLRSLPLYHNDPFDRMLVAQAQAECMIFLTIDKMVKKYDVEII
jgi:PIN domain nuclease of toxin-antitoxin system